MMSLRHGSLMQINACPTAKDDLEASLIGHSGSSAFQTIHHHYSVDVAHGLVLLGRRTTGSSWGSRGAGHL